MMPNPQRPPIYGRPGTDIGRHMTPKQIEDIFGGAPQAPSEPPPGPFPLPSPPLHVPTGPWDPDYANDPFATPQVEQVPGTTPPMPDPGFDFDPEIKISPGPAPVPPPLVPPGIDLGADMPYEIKSPDDFPWPDSGGSSGHKEPGFEFPVEDDPGTPMTPPPSGSFNLPRGGGFPSRPRNSFEGFDDLMEMYNEKWNNARPRDDMMRRTLGDALRGRGGMGGFQ